MTLAQNGQLGIPGTLSPTGLELPEDLTYDQWEQVGGTLRLMEGAVQFWIGDWIRYGQRRYGEMYSQALETTDYEHGSLRNMVYVAEQVELSLRNDNLSFAHHVAVAPLPPEKQSEMLDRAEKDGLSVTSLRAIIKAKKGDDTKPPAMPGAIVCPQCSYRFPRSKSTILAMFDEHELQDLRDRYPGIDLVYEAERFTDYWSEGKKALKRPRHAYRNWIENSWKYKDVKEAVEEWV
jgi:hypothetical protein